MIIPNNLEKKQCYNNVLKIYMENIREFLDGKYKMCIGVVQDLSMPQILIKHAYIVDKNNNIAYDYLQDTDPNRNLRYFNLKVIGAYSDIEDYIDLFDEDKVCDFRLNLSRFIKKEEKAFLMEHNFLDVFIGQDLYCISEENSYLLKF